MINEVLAVSSVEDYPISKNQIQWCLNEFEKMGMIPPIEPGRTVYDLDLGIPEWEEE